MGQNSKIEWTHHTFNPWWGCTRVSPGCENCYAETLDRRYNAKYPHWGPTAPRKFMSDAHWSKPLSWNRKAEAAGERHRVFVASMADVFEVHRDAEVSVMQDEARRRLWILTEQTPHLDWLLLTKRPENAILVPDWWCANAPENVWLGVTAEDQKRADERIPLLLEVTWPAKRFVSYEPALEAIDIARYLWPVHERWPSKFRSPEAARIAGAKVTKHPQALLSSHVRLVDWVIAGAESGPGARHMDLDWVRSVRDQCVASSTPFFFKQKLEGGRKVSLPELDGKVWAQVPGDGT